MSIVNFLYNKNVVLVGPSPSLKGSGAVIDKYEVVVRMNSALPIQDKDKEDVGTKTDILITGLSDDFMHHHSKKEDWRDRIKDVYENIWLKEKENGLKFIVCWHPTSTAFAQRQYVELKKIESGLESGLKIVTIPLSIHTEIRHACKCEPCTGVLAICYLMHFRLTRLYVTGLDFFEGGSYRPGYHPSMPQEITEAEGYKNKLKASGHDMDALKKYIDRFRYPVFHPDTKLKEALGWKDYTY